MRFSLATRDELPAIVEIYNDSVAERNATADLAPASVESRLAWFDAHKDRRPIYVLKGDIPRRNFSVRQGTDDENSARNEQILAWGSLSNYKDRAAYDITAEISVYVRKSARGRGLGRMTAEYLIRIAPSLGVKNILAVIFTDNAASVKMFEKLGFTRWGTLPQVCDMGGRLKSVEIFGKKV